MKLRIASTINHRTPQPGQSGFEDLFPPHPASGVEDGRKPDLGVDHAVTDKVFTRLIRNPFDSRGCLHDGDRVIEAREIALERPRVPLIEPIGQRRRVSRGQTLVSDGVGKLNHSRDAQPPVEVIVQLRFRQRPQHHPVHPRTVVDADASRRRS